MRWANKKFSLEAIPVFSETFDKKCFDAQFGREWKWYTYKVLENIEDYTFLFIILKTITNE